MNGILVRACNYLAGRGLGLFYFLIKRSFFKLEGSPWRVMQALTSATLSMKNVVKILIGENVD